MGLVVVDLTLSRHPDAGIDREGADQSGTIVKTAFSSNNRNQA